MVKTARRGTRCSLNTAPTTARNDRHPQIVRNPWRAQSPQTGAGQSPLSQPYGRAAGVAFGRGAGHPLGGGGDGTTPRPPSRRHGGARAGDEREEVAEAALSEGIASVGAVAGGLGILTNAGREIERLAMFGYPEEIVEGTRFVPIDALGPIATTARTGRAVWLATNAELFSQYPELVTIPARRQYGAAVSVPLAVGGTVIGVMSLRFAEERPFDTASRDLIEAIAGQCAQALERARLYEAERAARAEAEEAVRARDRFLSIAAHEF